MALTVEDLIEELKHMPMDMEVRFTYNYGDHWRTQVAESVRSVDMGFVEYSDYHRMDKVVEPDYEDEMEDPKDSYKAVVIIG